MGEWAGLHSPLHSQTSFTPPPEEAELDCRCFSRNCCRSMMMQRDPWRQYFKRYGLMHVFGQLLMFFVVICFTLRIFSSSLELNAHWFSISGSIIFVIRFLFMWLTTPYGPPYLSHKDGSARYFDKYDPYIKDQDVMGIPDVVV